MFHIIWASCGESCDQFQLILAGRNMSVRDHLGHFGWSWGAFHGFCWYVVKWLPCLCFLNVYVDGPPSERTQIGRICMLIMDSVMMMKCCCHFWGLWNVSVVQLFVSRDLHCIVGFVCTEGKEWMYLKVRPHR